MGTCGACGESTPLGALCPHHSELLASCDSITAEQLQSTGSGPPAAWIVDQWGAVHEVGEHEIFGRSAEATFRIAHHSISAVHAELRATDGTIRISDRGSLNGLFLNGARVRSEVVGDGDILRLGDVSICLRRIMPSGANVTGSGRTIPSSREELSYRVEIRAGNDRCELIESSSGGVLRTQGAEVDLAALEFSLLRVLADRMLKTRDAALAFVTARELVGEIAFQSQIADTDNVRELVRRVRRKLKDAGLPALIESRQNSGYRIGWPVKASR